MISQAGAVCFTCGPHFRSMKITQDVREDATQKEIDRGRRAGCRNEGKSEEFVAAGGEIYQLSETR